MPKLSEMQQIVAPKIVLYGEPRTGKTAWVMTGGEHVQLLDLDKGYRTGLYLKDKFLDERRKVDVISCYEDDPAKAKAFSQAQMELMRIADACLKGTYPFKVLAIDSLSALADFSLRQIMASSGGFTAKKEYQHWGIAISQIENILLILRSLPIAVVLIAHSKQKEINGVEKTVVGVFGQELPNTVVKYFDEVFYSKVVYGPSNTVQYKIQTKPTPMLVAGSRTNQGDDIDMNLGLKDTLGKMGYVL